MSKSVVAAVRTNSDNVLSDIERVMELANIKDSFDPGSQTILKDNISWHLHFPAANTTPWQLEGSIRSLKKNGFDDLIAVHNRTVVTRAKKGGRVNRLDPVYQKYEIPEIYNFNPDEIKWIRYRPKGKTPALDHVYPDGFKIPEQFIGTNIIHLPTIKCHIYTTTTGAIKNAFGGLLNSRRHYTHSYIHRTIVDLLLVQNEIHSGLFALMDGTHAGNGPGPRTMQPVQKNIMLASSDQVAIDAVAAKIMGFNPLEIDYIRIAHEEKLGIGDPRDIDLVGDDVANESWNFKVGDNFASLVGDQLWFGPMKKLQKLFFHTPLVNIFVMGSFIFHDYVWYPINSPKILQNFRKTEWGKLFDSRYGSHGEITR